MEMSDFVTNDVIDDDRGGGGVLRSRGSNNNNNFTSSTTTTIATICNKMSPDTEMSPGGSDFDFLILEK